MAEPRQSPGTRPSLTTSADHENLDFESEDLGATEDFLVRAYTKMTIGADAGERAITRIHRRWLGPISFDELELRFHMSYDAAPLGRICLCRVHDGHIEENFVGEPQDVFAPGDVTLFSPPELPYSGRVCEATYDLTMFDSALLDRMASPASGRPGEPVRLLGHRPVSHQAQRQLDAVIDYVRAVSRDANGKPTPLVASTTASLLASVVLSAFPNTATAQSNSTSDQADVKPTLLRRAVAYIDNHADSDIALADIAEHVHVTPRALQYMFRRHMDMTPMEYLRRVRMDHAHRELVNSDPAITTVQIIAARWGFPHTGRFAAMYRKTYGHRPSDTLRG